MLSLIEPNIHPILVHFAYALSVTAVGAYVLAAVAPAPGWKDTLRPAGDWMLAFGTLATIATVAAGFQAYYTVAHDAPSHAAMTTHRNWAVPSAIGLLLLAGWRWRARLRAPSNLFIILSVLSALSLTVTAWWGGHVVYSYGVGVRSLPTITGDGHDHDHGASSPGQAHPSSSDTQEAADEHGHGASEQPSTVMGSDNGTADAEVGVQADTRNGHHDDADGHHDGGDPHPDDTEDEGRGQTHDDHNH